MGGRRGVEKKGCPGGDMSENRFFGEAGGGGHLFILNADRVGEMARVIDVG